MFLNYTGSFTD